MRLISIALSLLLAACGGGGGDGGGGNPPPQVPSGTLSLFAGALLNGAGSVDAQGLAARFDGPSAIAIDPRTRIAYVADTNNQTIRQVTPDGMVSTFAGTLGQRGFADGPRGVASFNNVTALAIDTNGVLYALDAGNFAIRRIEADGRVTTLAGGHSTALPVDGIGTSASFGFLSAIAVDPFFNVYVGDEYVIRKISPSGVVSTVVGKRGELGVVSEGPGLQVRLAGQTYALASDAAGRIYFVDGANLRVLGPDGIVSTLVRATDERRDFFFASGLAVDAAGNIYVVDRSKALISKVNPQGQILTPPVAGTGRAGVDDGPRSTATIRQPGIAVDGAATRLLMAEPVDNVIRQVDLVTGNIVTIAGMGGPFFNAAPADGVGEAARFAPIIHLSADTSGNLFALTQRGIRKITPASQATTLYAPLPSPVGAITAGPAGTVFLAETVFCSQPGAHSDFPCRMKLQAIDATGVVTLIREFPNPWVPAALARDQQGNFYIALPQDTSIMKVDAGGTATPFWTGSASDVAVDASGIVYVADATHHVVLRIGADGIGTVLAGKSGEQGSTDGTGQDARFSAPIQIALDPAGNIYVADRDNYLVRKITPGGVVTTVAGTRGTRAFQPGPLPAVLREPFGIAVVGPDLFVAMPTAIAVVRNHP